MTKLNSRRHFLRDLATAAARRAPDLATGGAAGLFRPAANPRTGLDADRLGTTVAAMPRAVVSIGQLLEMAADCGLSRVAEPIAQLARKSLRFAPAPEGRRSTSFAGQSFVACIDLQQLGDASIIADGPQSLWVFGSGRAAIDERPPPSPPPGSRALLVLPELTIPRPWSAPVAELGLTELETEGWAQLRDKLAEAHGVPAGDSSPPATALHRVFGYPDERRGDMPLACELTARGFELGEEPANAHPAAASVEPEARRWRMLVQLSPDDELGWHWGEGFERVYLWTDTPVGRGELRPQRIVQ